VQDIKKRGALWTKRFAHGRSEISGRNRRCILLATEALPLLMDLFRFAKFGLICCVFLILSGITLINVAKDQNVLVSDQTEFFEAKNPDCMSLSERANEVFTEKEINDAILARKNWTKALPFTIEAYYGSAKEEVPHAHHRFNMLGPVAPQCTFLESYGVGDDEKRACGLMKILKPIEDCTIISVGSNNQWGFEEAIYAKIPWCRIETFDCTVSPDTAPPRGIADRTTFHRVCIGSKDETIGNQVFMSWRSILKLVNATQAPLYFKMDIEGYEYEVFRSIIDDGSLMPMQIAFEMHYGTSMSLPWRYRQKNPAEIAIFMEYLHHQGGYFLLDRHDNPAGPTVSELLISRLHC